MVKDVPVIFRTRRCRKCKYRVKTSEIFFDSDAERRIFVNNFLSEV